MCEVDGNGGRRDGTKTMPVAKAVGMVLAHDITEIRPGETFAGGGSAPFKGRAFRKGHVIKQEDICHLQRLGKEHLYILDLKDDEMHEDEAALALARALMGEGVEMDGEPREGKINIVASGDGLLKIHRQALFALNMLGEVMCATMRDGTVVRKGQVVAGTRAIPLVIKKELMDEALSIISGAGVIEVKKMRRPRAGVVITGNEVYFGRIQDAFAPVIKRKIEEFGGEITGLYYAPDDPAHITKRLEELMELGADILITTGGMSVDPDDVTRFAIRNLGAEEITYGSAVLPGAMFLMAYFKRTVPIIGIPACGMYAKNTVFDIIFPRVLAGERIGRKELAELGHGGLCLHCSECRYPICPFGKY